MEEQVNDIITTDDGGQVPPSNTNDKILNLYDYELNCHSDIFTVINKNIKSIMDKKGENYILYNMSLVDLYSKKDIIHYKTFKLEDIINNLLQCNSYKELKDIISKLFITSEATNNFMLFFTPFFNKMLNFQKHKVRSISNLYIDCDGLDDFTCLDGLLDILKQRLILVMSLTKKIYKEYQLTEFVNSNNEYMVFIKPYIVIHSDYNDSITFNNGVYILNNDNLKNDINHIEHLSGYGMLYIDFDKYIERGIIFNGIYINNEILLKTNYEI